MLLAVDFDEDVIDVEGISLSSVLSRQTAGIFSTDLATPQAYRLSSDNNSSLGK